MYEDEVAVGKVRSIYAVASKTAESSEGRKTTDGQCVPNTAYRNGMRGAKCEGAQITYTQKVQDMEQVT